MPATLTDSESTNSGPPPPSRWEMLRDLVVFQGKLLVDGLRDVVLVPVSLIAGVIDLFGGGDSHGDHFYGIMIWGRRSERWINLFGAADRVPGGWNLEGDVGIDQMVGRVEQLLVEQYQKGGVTKSAKSAIDKVLDTIQRRQPPSM